MLFNFLAILTQVNATSFEVRMSEVFVRILVNSKKMVKLITYYQNEIEKKQNGVGGFG